MSTNIEKCYQHNHLSETFPLPVLPVAIRVNSVIAMVHASGRAIGILGSRQPRRIFCIYDGISVDCLWLMQKLIFIISLNI